MSVDRQFDFRDADFSRVRKMIHAHAGISLGTHKREMVYSRLARRCALGLQDFGSYLDQLENEPGAAEWEDFVNALTTNLTAFFPGIPSFPHPGGLRPAAQRAGVGLVLRGVHRRRAVLHRHDTGGGAGPAGFLVLGAGHRHRHQRAGPGARRGLSRGTRGEDGRGASAAVFLKGRGANAGQVRVRPEIADMVRYETLNLLAPAWPIDEKFDVIFCRNVMIYFDKPTQAKILERFVPLLKPGGLLFAGHSENFTYISRDFRLRGQTVYECAGKA